MSFDPSFLRNLRLPREILPHFTGVICGTITNNLFFPLLLSLLTVYHACPVAQIDGTGVSRPSCPVKSESYLTGVNGKEKNIYLCVLCASAVNTGSLESA